LREPLIQFQHLKISLGMGLSQVLPEFEPFNSGSITIFQIQEPFNLVFEPDPVLCTHCTFPNAKDYVVQSLTNN
jgi:hypothetical protein